MQSTKQQQILGYFIEEAREHLDTIENGLLNLQTTMADQESVNELFRAAHSIKGGAAMLGFGSIQQIAHHFEECFKILKDHPITIDQKLEALFLGGFDTLKDLLEALQAPYGLRQEEAEEAVKAAAPTFDQLESYLRRSIQSGVRPAMTAVPVAPPAPKVASVQTNPTTQITALLKQMLQLFKQGDSASGRRQLGEICDRLVQAHPAQNWQELVQTAQAAIANPRNIYQTLAPIIIKELKQASDLLSVSRSDEITPSRNLQQLAGISKLPVATPSLTREATSGKHQQISVPLDPKAASKVLLNAFNKDQLVELADLILRAIQ